MSTIYVRMLLACHQCLADGDTAVDLSGLTGQDKLYFQALKNSPFTLEPVDWQPEANGMEASGDMDEDFEPRSNLLPLKRAGIYKRVTFLG